MTVLREIQGPAGTLEVLLDKPAERGVTGEGLLATGADSGIRAAVVLGHPHPQRGGTMHTKGIYHTAKGLSRIGCVVLRFNFRGIGKSEGAWDEGEGEKADFRAALDFMAAQYPSVPLWAGGMSFGSWVGMNVGVEDPRVSTLIGIHPLRFWRADLPVDVRLYSGIGAFEVLYYYETEFQTEAKGKAWTGTSLPFGLQTEYKIDRDGAFAIGVDLRLVRGSYNKWIYNNDKDIASRLDDAPVTTLRFAPRLTFGFHF